LFEDIVNLSPMARGRVTVTEVVVQTDSPAVGQTLIEMRLPAGTLVGSIIRGDEVFVPSGASRVEGGDRLIVISTPEWQAAALRRLTGEAA